MRPLKSIINDRELRGSVGNKLIRGARLELPPKRASPNYYCWRQEYLARKTTGLAHEIFDVLKSLCPRCRLGVVQRPEEKSSIIL